MVKLFNTLSQKEEVLEPYDPARVGMYVCGPTVYDHAHIGHARAYVSYDVIVRYLTYRNYNVLYVRNITDIDDKIIKKANEEGKDFREIAERYTASFHEDMGTLGLLAPQIEPKASQVIEEIITMVQTLVSKQKAYPSNGDVYFPVAKIPDYGKLSRRNLKDLKVGARVEPGEHKRDPLDFALWKGAKLHEPSWPSPWGPGRPAWHIECSVMAKKFLGESIDVHAGGRDLIFPHHENEIAQSEAANEKTFSKYWLHNGFVTFANEKMSKSLGNTVTLKDLFKKFHPEALKIYLLSNHYRSPLEFSDTGVEEAARGLDRFYRVLLAVPPQTKDHSQAINYVNRFEAAMDHDFNTAQAIGVLFDLAKEINRLSLKAETFEKAQAFRETLNQKAQVLGLLTCDPQKYFQTIPWWARGGATGIDRLQIEKLIADRAEARRQKDFKKGDQIRDQLKGMGVLLEDSPEGTTWRLLKAGEKNL